MCAENSCIVRDKVIQILDRMDYSNNSSFESLYHYTKRDNLLNILKNQYLLMNPTHSLSDHLEVEYGLSLLVECAKECKYPPEYIKKLTCMVNSGLLFLTSSFSSQLVGKMWYYFADRFSGAAIEFDKVFFELKKHKREKSKERYDVYFQKIMYCEKDFKVVLKEILETNELKCGCGFCEDHYVTPLLYASSLLPTMKHEYFNFEEEYRIIFADMRPPDEGYYLHSSHLVFEDDLIFGDRNYRVKHPFELDQIKAIHLYDTLNPGENAAYIDRVKEYVPDVKIKFHTLKEEDKNLFSPLINIIY